MANFESKTFTNDSLSSLERNIKDFVNKENPTQFSFSICFRSESKNSADRNKYVAILLYKK